VHNSCTLPIDWQLCLSVTGNNTAIAHEMLQGFMHELPEQIKAIKMHYQNGDYSALQKHLHQLHGATCYCGMPKLQKQLHQLETQLKKSQHDCFAEYLQIMFIELEHIQNYYHNEFEHSR
jgi:two-component system, NarL family, sensor histidine kinase BarA